MGIPSELRDIWIANKNTSLLIASPAEDQKMLRSSQCTAGNYYFSYNISSIVFGSDLTRILVKHTSSQF